MINVEQLKKYVIHPTLKELDLYSEAATNLLLGTAAQESQLEFIQQIKGPAISIYQIEPLTHFDIWKNYVDYRRDLSVTLRQIAGYKYRTTDINPIEMYGNLFYATAICRIHYLRVKEPLPEAYDVEGLALYWKKYFNTKLGKGTVEDFTGNYIRLVLGQ